MDKHTYSVETLYHYCCCFCSRWWSIADIVPTSEKMCCPHCGVCEDIEEVGKEDA